MAARGHERIVVGVDRSDVSKAALSWAAHQATLTGASLDVVAAWEFPASYGWEVMLPDGIDLGGEAKVALAQTVREVLGDEPGVEVAQLVIEGHPTFVLLHESDAVALLVVGCRGLGAFKGMLLVGEPYLATHARCPVVIIHDHVDEDHGISAGGPA